MQIVRTRRYLKDLKRIGATEDEVAELERSIAHDPTVGDVIPGLRGIRKVRFRMGGKGKRGGGRAVYFLMVADDMALMLTAYAKSAQEDLTNEQKKAVLALLEELTDGED